MNATKPNLKTLAALMAAIAILGVARIATLGADGDQRIAVVNVSLVFEKYDKVADVQRQIDARFKPRKNDLDKRIEDLKIRNRELEQIYQEKSNSEVVFDAVQKLRKDQFVFERDVGILEGDIQVEYTKKMREVLTEIRVAIRDTAEHSKFELVLRSPDADDPDIVPGDPTKPKDPAEKDKRTYLELTAPKTTFEVLERFHRNPVLYGNQTSDLTQEILKKLNDDYARKGNPGAAPVKKD